MTPADAEARVVAWLASQPSERRQYLRPAAAQLRRLLDLEAERDALWERFQADETLEAEWDAMVIRMGRMVANMRACRLWATDIIDESEEVGHYPDVGCNCERCDYVFEVEIASVAVFHGELIPPSVSGVRQRHAMRLGLRWHRGRVAALKREQNLEVWSG